MGPIQLGRCRLSPCSQRGCPHLQAVLLPEPQICSSVGFPLDLAPGWPHLYCTSWFPVLTKGTTSHPGPSSQTMGSPPCPHCPVHNHSHPQSGYDGVRLLNIPGAPPVPSPHVLLATEGTPHLRSWALGPLVHQDCPGAPSRTPGPSLALSSFDRTTSLCRGWGEVGGGRQDVWMGLAASLSPQGW